MILTVCLNPSFDRTVTVEDFKAGATNRALSVREDPGGKGINVARVIDRLGEESLCIVVMGENGADKLESMLDKEDVCRKSFIVPGTVRTNLKIISMPGSILTELNEPGPSLNEEQQTEIMSVIFREAEKAEWVVLTGSLPAGCPSTFYRDIMLRLPEGKCILDASGKTLTASLSGKPFLIKPNLDELTAAAGHELNDHTQIRNAARELINQGAKAAVVSMGGDGAMLVTDKECFFSPALPVRVASSVGAGDAMLGTMLCGLKKTGSLREAFRWGCAGGACSVMTEGTGLIDPQSFEGLPERVQITEVF